MVKDNTYENYIGSLISSERYRRRLASADVYSGICSQSIYNKLENGGYSGNIHVLRAVLQRLGLNAGRSGAYLNAEEYGEMYDRLLILESIREGETDKAAEQLETYEMKYKDKSRLNIQFTDNIWARITELNGDYREALKLYKRAVMHTMKDYDADSELACISVYEFFMISNIARLTAKEGDVRTAVTLYRKLLGYCSTSSAEIWNNACMYPKAVCELLDIVAPDTMDRCGLYEMYEHCRAALEVLRKASRLHFVRPLLRYMGIIENMLGIEDDGGWDEFLECYEKLCEEYEHRGELFEWYPYYLDSDFCPVEKLIDERRQMHGMSMEELAGTDCSVKTVSRIINGNNSPSYNTSKRLLDKLGLKGVLRCDIVVADNIEAHKLWDELGECLVVNDYTAAEKIYEKLGQLLDSSIEINRMVLGYMKIRLDTCKEKPDYDEVAEQCRMLLPFPVLDAGKYKYLTQIERMIVNVYFECMDKLKRYEKLDIFDAVRLQCTDTELDMRRYASHYESVSARLASFWGNAGNFAKSNYIAEEGIRLELQCERMLLLSSLLYCTSWNDGECHNVTERDIRLCKCAYKMAEYMRNPKKMKIYKKWLDAHTNSIDAKTE